MTTTSVANLHRCNTRLWKHFLEKNYLRFRATNNNQSPFNSIHSCHIANLHSILSLIIYYTDWGDCWPDKKHTLPAPQTNNLDLNITRNNSSTVTKYGLYPTHSSWTNGLHIFIIYHNPCYVWHRPDAPHSGRLASLYKYEIKSYLFCIAVARKKAVELKPAIKITWKGASRVNKIDQL